MTKTSLSCGVGKLVFLRIRKESRFHLKVVPFLVKGRSMNAFSSGDLPSNSWYMLLFCRRRLTLGVSNGLRMVFFCPKTLWMLFFLVLLPCTELFQTRVHMLSVKDACDLSSNAALIFPMDGTVADSTRHQEEDYGTLPPVTSSADISPALSNASVNTRRVPSFSGGSSSPRDDPVGGTHDRNEHDSSPKKPGPPLSQGREMTEASYWSLLALDLAYPVWSFPPPSCTLMLFFYFCV